MSDSSKSPATNGTFPAPPYPEEDPTEVLKVRLEETRLPPHLKEEILAELPPPDEQERLYRELQAQGGYSFEQLFDSLYVEIGPKP
jgi:hypothetical protein